MQKRCVRLTERVPREPRQLDPIARWRDLPVVQVFIVERSPLDRPKNEVVRKRKLSKGAPRVCSHLQCQREKAMGAGEQRQCGACVNAVLARERKSEIADVLSAFC